MLYRQPKQRSDPVTPTEIANTNNAEALITNRRTRRSSTIMQTSLLRPSKEPISQLKEPVSIDDNQDRPLFNGKITNGISKRTHLPPARQHLAPFPVRPSAPINNLPSMESYSPEAPTAKNGFARQRGPVTVTPRRTVSMLITSPNKTAELNSSNSSSHSRLSISPNGKANTPQRDGLPPYTYTNGVPWSSRGSLHSGSPEKNYLGTSSTLQLMADPNLPPSATGSVWEGDGNTVTSFGMETEILEHDDLDEEMAQAIHAVQDAHIKKTTHYKRLLEQAQSSSASQLHALQAELRLLRATLDNERNISHQNELARDRDRLALALNQNTARNEEAVTDFAAALRGDGKGFNETEVRKAVRAMQLSERMRLIGVILDCCIPGDISAQIRLLEKYQRSTFDVISAVPVALGLNILRYLTVPQLLNIETVCRKWQSLVHNPVLWREHCLALTETDPVPLRPPSDPTEWEPLYRSLHHRESNWKNALPQSIRFLSGHTDFCTTLNLKGKRLISGSYDKTIRFWDIETGEEKKCIHVNKAVSCLDFLAEEEVFAVGFHDIGRVHLFSSVTYNPLQQVQGHLNGIKAIALSSKHLISAGADKALVAWDWRAGTKIVRFGQQTSPNIGVQILGANSHNDDIGERFVSVTIDGMVRVFSIKRREMLSQFTLSHLGGGDPVLTSKIANIGSNAHNNMLQWFAAKGNQMTCATKSVILHLEWQEETEPLVSPINDQSSSNLSSPTTSTGPRTPNTSAPPVIRPRNISGLKSSGGPLNSPMSPSNAALRRSGTIPRLSLPTPNAPRAPTMLTIPLQPSPRTPSHGAATLSTPTKQRALSIALAPPRIMAVIETPDIAVGGVDPRKRRVVTSTRFASRTGADRRIFVSTHKESDGSSASPVLNGLEAISNEVDEMPTPTESSPHPPLLTHSRRSSVGTMQSGRSGSTAVEGAQTPGSGLYVDYNTGLDALTGVWGALAVPDDLALDASITFKQVEGVSGSLPGKFKGLATPAMNPMSFALNHEEVVVGCSDGTIYVMSFVGYKYTQIPLQLEDTLEPVSELENGTSEETAIRVSEEAD